MPLSRQTGARLRAEILEAATNIAAGYGFTVVEADPVRYDREGGLFRLRIDGFTAEAFAARRAALYDMARAQGFDPDQPGENGAVLVDYDATRDSPWLYERDGTRYAVNLTRAKVIWPAPKG